MYFQGKNLLLLDKLQKDPEEPLIIFTASNKKFCGFKELLHLLPDFLNPQGLKLQRKML